MKAILLLLILSIYLPSSFATVNRCKKGKQNSPHYSLIIDAGSSGSRIYIYHLQPSSDDELPTVTLIGKRKVNPGISAFPDNEKSVLDSMGVLLNFAKGMIDSASWTETKLYLMATAGIRLLEKKEQQETMSELTKYFKENADFKFKKAIILSGQYEALYGWTAINYLDDSFDPTTPRESMLEMGGASTQITFLSKESRGNHILNRKYGSAKYAIFAKSYLNMGQDRAQQLVAVPACYPVGYPYPNDTLTGTGNFMECSQEIERIFNEICDSLGIADSLFKSNFQANTENEYLAIAAFYYTFSFLNLKDSLTLDDLRARGEDFCGRTWEDIIERYKPSDYLKSYCFNATYFWTLLGKEYGFANNLVFSTKNDIYKQEATWTLGAALDLEMGYKPRKYR